jgi:multiple sugar transport system permease protein
MEASGGVVAPRTGVREGEEEREEARAVARRGPRRNWVRPLFMWIAVLFICVFCLFPFYWLINVSLKTGSDLSSADLFPPSPTLDN